jgi:hypothetical protein
VGEQHFEAIPNVPNWHNVVPRIGGAYDLFGDGRTALKGNWGVYMSGQGPNFVQAYNPTFTAVDTRNWTDLNRDDIAQENEIGPGSTTFGVRRNQHPDPNIERPYQMLWDFGVVREVLPGFGLAVSFAQRNVYQDIWTNNLAVNPSDYILLTVPDPRGNGELLPVYNLPPDKFGLVNELDTNSDLNSRVYRGVDVSASVRFPGGGSLVLQQGQNADDRNATAFQLERLVRIDRLVEGDAVRSIQDVDPSRWQPDLEDAVVGREIGFADFKPVQGGAERSQRAVDARGVCRGGANEHVQVLRGPGMAVIGNRVATEHHELGAGVVKLDEEIAKILGQADHAERPGTNRKGMRSRV